MDPGNICPKDKNISIDIIVIVTIIYSRRSIIDEIVAANAIVRKPLGYFWFNIFYYLSPSFLYAHPRNNGGLKIARNNGV